MKSIINIKAKYKPKNEHELIDLVNDLSIKLYEIDTSLITDMSDLFNNSNRKENKDFEGIEIWDVSNVEDMSGMFCGQLTFNQPLNSWDVSNLVYAYDMFYNCTNFNQPLNNWNVSKVKNMSCMFYGCENFNQPLSDWDVSNTNGMLFMFANCKKLNQDMSKWNLKHCTNDGMFEKCPIKSEFRPKRN